MAEADNLFEKYAQALDERAALEVESRHLREALNWYAEPANYTNAEVNETKPGQRARDALATLSSRR